METIVQPEPAAIVRFGTFELNLHSGELRKRGLRIALQEQPFRILTALLARPGEVVDRDELCQCLWPEGTFVDFEHGLNAAVRRLRLALGDDADVPRFVETVHKRGYRFLAINRRAPDATCSDNGSGNRVREAMIVAHIGPPRVRLAVLPFSPSDTFTDGLTEEAITQLTQACPRSIGIVARTSVERAQLAGGGTADIGRALSADYLVEGHVRRDGHRLRITVQLIESQEETHVWASTFDRVMTDALAIQAEVAELLARAVCDALSNIQRMAS